MFDLIGNRIRSPEITLLREGKAEEIFAVRRVAIILKNRATLNMYSVNVRFHMNRTFRYLRICHSVKNGKSGKIIFLIADHNCICIGLIAVINDIFGDTYLSCSCNVRVAFSRISIPIQNSIIGLLVSKVLFCYHSGISNYDLLIVFSIMTHRTYQVQSKAVAINSLSNRCYTPIIILNRKTVRYELLFT